MKESAPETAEALLAWWKLVVSSIQSLTVKDCSHIWNGGNGRVKVW